MGVVVAAVVVVVVVVVIVVVAVVITLCHLQVVNKSGNKIQLPRDACVLKTNRTILLNITLPVSASTVNFHFAVKFDLKVAVGKVANAFS